MGQNGAATPLIVVAAFVPLIVFGSLQLASQLQSRSQEAIASTLQRAEGVNLKVDAVILSDLSALAVLATSRSFETDLDLARQRAEAVAERHPRWRNVILSDFATGEIIWTTASVAEESERTSVAAYLEGGAQSPIGDIHDHPESCACISIHQPVETGGALRFVITVERDTADLQSILMESLGEGEVAGIVDRRGHFLARSVDYEAKLSEPATVYVRNAIKSNREGIYAGVTYEGFRNRSAFSTSPVTGWSTHIAVPPARFTAFEVGSVGFTALAALLSLAFAAGFVWFAVRNVRRQRLAEERNTQARKLQALGQLTGGIAHDFNNLLAVIISGLTLLQRRLASGDYDVAKYVEGAIDSAQRASALTRRLLAFSRQQPVAPEPVDANHVISSMIELLSRTLGAQVQLRPQLANDLWSVFVDSHQLENALLNLAVNARDAMPKGGKLTISTRNELVRAERSVSEGIPAGPYVVISVADTGVGMDEATRSRALEPFFTTKPGGKGTGLGLSQVLGFVEQSSGHLTIRSRLGAGTEVRLYFPRHDGAARRGRRPAANADLPAGKKNELILVVEDEEQVRDNTAASLRELGYSTLVASDGREALNLVGARRDVALLFTDIVMPGMNGRELAEAARAQRADLKVLFMTGYDPAVTEKPGASDDILAKPFSLQQLAFKVRSALDG